MHDRSLAVKTGIPRTRLLISIANPFLPRTSNPSLPIVKYLPRELVVVSVHTYEDIFELTSNVPEVNRNDLSTYAQGMPERKSVRQKVSSEDQGILSMLSNVNNTSQRIIEVQKIRCNVG